MKSRHRASRGRSVAAAMLVALAGATACRQDMHDAPRYKPLEQSDFFAGRARRRGRSSRARSRAAT